MSRGDSRTASRTALVTGATGAIGPTLVQHLLAAGWNVRTLTRQPPAGLPASIDARLGDITDPAAVTQAVPGADVIFHLAALLHIENPPPDLDAAYQRINVEGTRLLAEAAARTGVRRFVYFSTVKVYGTHQREPVPETAPTAPTTTYARTKLAGERAAHAVPGLETVTLRLSPVYGPRVKGSWARLIRAVERGRFVPIGALRNVHSLTHVADVARAALLAADHPAAAGQCFNVVGHETPTLEDILSAIYAAHGRRLPRLRLPAALAYAAAYGGDAVLGLIGRRSPLPVTAVRQLAEDEAYSGAALRTLGFSPLMPLCDGWTTDEGAA